LTSFPSGTFNFYEKERIGEWVIDSFKDSTTSCKLSGILKSSDVSSTELSGYIVAIVNMKIVDYTFSGSNIEKVTCSL
jgi:hypothetical protein